MEETVRAMRVVRLECNQVEINQTGNGSSDVGDIEAQVLAHHVRSPATDTEATGCKVLNTATAMFTDVDLPKATVLGGLGYLFRRIFGKVPQPTRGALEKRKSSRGWKGFARQMRPGGCDSTAPLPD